MPVVPVLAVLMAVPVAPLAFELQAPDGPEWSQRAKDAARVARRTLEARSRLEMRSGRRLGASRSRLRECRRQPSLSCWVRVLAEVGPDPFDRQGSIDRFLLVRLLPLPRPSRALVLIWLVDMVPARRGAIDLPPNELEGWLLQNATDRRRLEVTWGDGALERAFERLWDDNAASLRRSGHWWPNGSVRLQTRLTPPYQFSIDDGPVRTATSAVFVVPKVPAGTRQVELRADDRRVVRRVTVELGRQSVLHVDAVAAAAPRDDRPLLLWSGLGLAAAGVAVTVAGLAAPVKTELVQLCGASDACDRQEGFARASDYFSTRSEPDAGSGPLVVPLGYSLFITGGAWALTGWLYDEPQVPWWLVLAGGLAGGAAYAISEVAQ